MKISIKNNRKQRPQTAKVSFPSKKSKQSSSKNKDVKLNPFCDPKVLRNAQKRRNQTVNTSHELTAQLKNILASRDSSVPSSAKKKVNFVNSQQIHDSYISDL